MVRMDVGQGRKGEKHRVTTLEGKYLPCMPGNGESCISHQITITKAEQTI